MSAFVGASDHVLLFFSAVLILSVAGPYSRAGGGGGGGQSPTRELQNPVFGGRERERERESERDILSSSTTCIASHGMCA